MTGTNLIIGASSGIGEAIAKYMASKGMPVILSARNEEKLNAIADDLRVRYQTKIDVIPFDVSDFDRHEEYVQQIIEAAQGGSAGALAGVVCCQGYMAEQEKAANDFSLARKMIDVNFTANVSILDRFANHFESRKAGYICGISSVAGDRGRQSNYLYGSSKAAFSCYLQGLRNRLFRSQVAVVTVKPGFVDTAMTWGLLDPKSPMVASAERVAKDIVRAIEKKKAVIYTPWFWRVIMRIITTIPEFVFKRLSM